MDFVLYCAVNNVNDGRIYGFKNTMTRVSSLLYKYLLSLNRKLGKAVDKYGCFRSMDDFEELRKEADKLINQCVKMGEGWAYYGRNGLSCQDRYFEYRLYSAFRLSA